MAAIPACIAVQAGTDATAGLLDLGKNEMRLDPELLPSTLAQHTNIASRDLLKDALGEQL